MIGTNPILVFTEVNPGEESAILASRIFAVNPNPKTILVLL